MPTGKTFIKPTNQPRFSNKSGQRSLSGILTIRGLGSQHFNRGESFFHLMNNAARFYHDYPGKKPHSGFIQPKNLCDVNAVRNAFHLKNISWQGWWNKLFEDNPMFDPSHTEWVDAGPKGEGDRTLEGPNEKLQKLDVTKQVGSSLFWSMFALAGYLPNSIKPSFTQVSAEDLIKAIDEHGAIVISIKNMALRDHGSKYISHHTITAFDYKKTANGCTIYSIDGDDTTDKAAKLAEYAKAKGKLVPQLEPEEISQIEGSDALVRADNAEQLASNICRPILAPQGNE